jgi:hypothetical protein
MQYAPLLVVNMTTSICFLDLQLMDDCPNLKIDLLMAFDPSSIDPSALLNPANAVVP